MPGAAPYIPPPDADFDLWLDNFTDLIVANPTNYGLVAGDATAIDAVRDAWVTAWALVVVPATRTSVTIAAKDVARFNAEAVVRPYAQRVRNNAAVSDGLKVGLGLNVPPATNTPVPPPSTFPVLGLRSITPGAMLLQYQDSGGGSGKAKPYGNIQVQIFVTVGAAPAVDPDAALYKASVSKSPFTITFDPSQAGDVATIWARYVTRSGPAGVSQTGPWSSALAATIA